MGESTAQRTLVKSPPELWAEISDAASLARHLGELGEIRITRLEPESAVDWEADRAAGRVEIKPSGWGTRVTITAQESPAAERDEEAEVGEEPDELVGERAEAVEDQAEVTEDQAEVTEEPEVAKPTTAATQADGSWRPFVAAAPVAKDPPTPAPTATSSAVGRQTGNTDGFAGPEGLDDDAATAVGRENGNTDGFAGPEAGEEAMALEPYGPIVIHPTPAAAPAATSEPAAAAALTATSEPDAPAAPEPTAAPEAEALSEPEAAEPEPEPASKPRRGFFARLFRRRAEAPEAPSQPEAPEPGPDLVPVPDPEPEPELPEPTPLPVPDPEPAPPAAAEHVEEPAAHATPELDATPATDATPTPEPAQTPAPEPDPPAPSLDVAAVLTGALDSLGQAHHRPFSRG